MSKRMDEIISPEDNPKSEIAKRYNSDDVAEQLEFALKVMKRTDMWITSCDSKASILLGIIGVILTIIFTTGSANNMYEMARHIFSNCELPFVCIWAFMLLLAVAFYCKAFFHIINVVLARLDKSKFKQDCLKEKSNIFFGSISEKQYKEYKEDFENQDLAGHLNDVLSQVYINSCIAKEKHKHYNKSLLWTGISFAYTCLIVIVAEIVI